MVSPKQLEEDIKNVDYDQINKMIDNSTNQVDTNFWLAIRDRALQLRQKQIINRKDFIR
ncbi:MULTISPECIES: hypothetical protein [Lactobacillus]|uniref:hypothetical protein n=1 Tax=Lactobacillus TaxID=1578 RepID=UPI001C69E87F|nr:MULTISPECIES: hypothetical protein [Lactobacillus]MCO6532071.1 hypothetical protein [Lactobacillus sp.]MCX8722141.1 hypothetical protein [Lactobacillus sp. B4010]MCX8732779.1 hypothetical protein [Lactobacillus sp. B4015]MCX8734999.1 hypothetical protein [Lactobacillus sp. B4012]QYN59384.1 hypothetical protein GYM68_09090 [Lactobacillus panisapium]